MVQFTHQTFILTTAAAGYGSAEGHFIYDTLPPFHNPSAHTHESKTRGSSQGWNLGNALFPPFQGSGVQGGQTEGLMQREKLIR